MSPQDEWRAGETSTYRLARRAMLKATGGAAALSLGAGTAAVGNHGGSHSGSGNGPGTGDGGSNPNYLDPIFGKASAEPKPESFRPPVRPDHEVDMLIGFQGLVFGAAEVLSDEQKQTVNEAVKDGTVGELSDEPIPDLDDASLRDVGNALLATLGFYFEPAGLWVEPGDAVVFDAKTPDHLVASYHERHGRQNRVPGDLDSGTGLIASPLIPVEGYWLYKFEEPGVYDLNCTVHEIFGMVMRVVVTDDPDEVPERDVEGGSPDLRPPEGSNEIELVFGGLDPDLPSAAGVLGTDALDPQNIVDEGKVDWEAVVEEHRNES